MIFIYVKYPPVLINYAKPKNLSRIMVMDYVRLLFLLHLIYMLTFSFHHKLIDD